MRTILVPSIAIVALTFSAVAAAADLQSGLKVGESAGAFNIRDCTGPNAGKTLCYR